MIRMNDAELRPAGIVATAEFLQELRDRAGQGLREFGIGQKVTAWLVTAQRTRRSQLVAPLDVGKLLDEFSHKVTAFLFGLLSSGNAAIDITGNRPNSNPKQHGTKRIRIPFILSS